jgi:hypothetical protein
MPAITGRSPIYIARELYEFRDGSRGGMSANPMKPVVANLTDDDIVAISAYLASRPPASCAGTDGVNRGEWPLATAPDSHRDHPLQNGFPRSIERGLLTMPTPAPTMPPTTTPGGPPIRPIPAPIPAPESPRSPIAVPQPERTTAAKMINPIAFIFASPSNARSKTALMANVPVWASGPP